MAVVVIVFGVAVFAYVLSNLATEFSIITMDASTNNNRIQEVE